MFLYCISTYNSCDYHNNLFLIISLSGFCVAALLDSCDITPPVLSAMSEATPVSIEP